MKTVFIKPNLNGFESFYNSKNILGRGAGALADSHAGYIR